jgi:uncharacterized LabA/DUF88 family protein
MNRFALFVDAGYFFAGGAEAAFEGKVSRQEFRIDDIEKCLEDLQRYARERCPGHEMLRIYWYDAPPKTGLSIEQANLALQTGMKLRLGVLNNVGEQKGVDSLIVTDLIELARNRAISDAVLLSGDEDVRIGVEVAQSFGLRVHLLGIGNFERNVSRLLKMESDSFKGIDADWCKATFTLGGYGSFGSSADPAQSKWIEVGEEAFGDLESAAKAICEKIVKGKSSTDCAELLKSIEFQNGSIPADIDRGLIASTAKAMGDVYLSPEEKRLIRKTFKDFLLAL